MLIGQTKSSMWDDQWVNILTSQEEKPKIFIYLHQPGGLLQDPDRIKRMERLLDKKGYLGCTRTLSSQKCGAPVHGSHTISVFTLRSSKIPSKDVMDYPVGSEELGPRGFNNCLIPPGLLQIKTHYGKTKPVEGEEYGNSLGVFRKNLVVDPDGPAPPHNHLWIPFREKGF